MKTTSICIPDDIHKSLKLLCVEKGISMTQYIVDIIGAAINQNESGQDLREKLTADIHTENAFVKGAISKMKVPINDVLKIRERVSSGESRESIAKEYGVSITVIGRVINGKGFYAIP